MAEKNEQYGNILVQVQGNEVTIFGGLFQDIKIDSGIFTSEENANGVFRLICSALSNHSILSEQELANERDKPFPSKSGGSRVFPPGY